MKTPSPGILKERAEIDAFNRAFPVGSPVIVTLAGGVEYATTSRSPMTAQGAFLTGLICPYPICAIRRPRTRRLTLSGVAGRVAVDRGEER